jgi:urea transport system permease protein
MFEINRQESVENLRHWVQNLGLITLFIIIPLLFGFGVVGNYDMTRLGRYLCFAIVALGIDLIWGYTGILSLCQAFFFALGSYAVGMFLSLPQGGGNVRPEYNQIPQFLFYNNWQELPQFWQPFESLYFAVFVGLLIPGIIAALFGYFIFYGRSKGVFFAIITQALAWAAYIAFCRNEMLLGGTNGLNDFDQDLNQSFQGILTLYLLSATVLVSAIYLCGKLTESAFGSVLVAIRDNETRLRFLGYTPESFKIFVFVTAACLAAIAGMLFVPQNGGVNPDNMAVEFSILMVVWVAVGGRGHLWGAVFGALFVNYLYSALTNDVPKLWPFIQGTLFLVAVLYRGGLAGLWMNLETRMRLRRSVLPPVLALWSFVVFVITEALDLVPSTLETAWFGLELRYWFFASVLCLAGILSLTEEKSWRDLLRFSPIFNGGK